MTGCFFYSNKLNILVQREFLLLPCIIYVLHLFPTCTSLNYSARSTGLWQNVAIKVSIMDDALIRANILLYFVRRNLNGTCIYLWSQTRWSQQMIPSVYRRDALCVDIIQNPPHGCNDGLDGRGNANTAPWQYYSGCTRNLSLGVTIAGWDVSSSFDYCQAVTLLVNRSSEPKMRKREQYWLVCIRLSTDLIALDTG